MTADQLPMDAYCIRAINKPNPTTGYSLRVIDGKRQYEHVAAWEKVNGPVPGPGSPLPRSGDLSVAGSEMSSPVLPEPRASGSDDQGRARGFNVGRAMTHCGKGHEFTAENTYVTKSGGRRCRTCYRAYLRNWKKARRG